MAAHNPGKKRGACAPIPLSTPCNALPCTRPFLEGVLIVSRQLFGNRNDVFIPISRKKALLGMKTAFSFPFKQFCAIPDQKHNPERGGTVDGCTESWGGWMEEADG
jgi:hypothetical protein